MGILIKFLLYFSLVFIFTGCSIKTPSINTNKNHSHQNEAKIVNTLNSYINKNTGKDCSDFVSIVNKELQNIYFEEKELNFALATTKSEAIYNLFEKQGKILTKGLPNIGDLIFFKDTVKSSKIKPQISHIGIVSDVHDDNTIIFIHQLNGKVTKGHINLNNMDSHNINGKIVNSFIVRCPTKNTPNHKCLSSKFLAGYGKITKHSIK